MSKRNAEESCDVLLDVLAQIDNLAGTTRSQREALRMFAVKDLLRWTNELPVAVYESYWWQAQKWTLPEEVRQRLKGGPESSDLQPGHLPVEQMRLIGGRDKAIATDIVILTVIQAEFDACLRAFGIDPAARRQPRYLPGRGHKYFRTVIQNQAGRDIDVHITMIGEPRDVPCTNACRDIFENFNLKACLLVGIAGGKRGGVNLADVVGATQVFDVEGGKFAPYPLKKYGPFRRLQLRLESRDLRSPIKEQFLNLDLSDGGWVKEYQHHVEQARKRDPTIAHQAPSVSPNYRQGVIVSYEKVLADGRLPKVARGLSDRVLAIEMEGSGFAKTCSYCGVPWLIFRGVSDFGDPNKSESDGWQVPAAFAAAIVARLFIATEFRAPDEELEF